MSKERPKTETVDPRLASRRKFLKGCAAGAAAVALPAPVLAQGGFLTYGSWKEYFQKQFRQMSPKEVQEALRRMEEKYTRQYGRKVTVKATPPVPNAVFGYALNLNVCIGCRRCAYACVKENNQSRQAEQIQYIKVLRFKNGEMEFEKSERHYNMPVQCQHCQNAPCVKACPIKATWTEPDGLVVVDYNWCIGCRYCMAACPYEQRFFNWLDPKLPPEELNPETHYLGNRPRMRGVVEKCTYCIQRVREGRYPACVEACPVGARKFGNLLDPKSEIRAILETKRVFRIKEDLLTEPKFFYFFG
ncbi:MAG: 4Fe-4S dicluster domain-containing protein [Deltaproteobacteria bacterium]|nr:4Fe-4S dicluster domain-containing protein [Deltaproteobacteria bacterium]